MPRKTTGLTLLLLLACVTVLHAQAGDWVWEAGLASNLGIPVYGTLGTPSTQNLPALRYGSGTWTDANGNLWLFGGYGSDSVYNYGYLNDLWEYNPANATWTWVGGSNLIGSNYGQSGVYGTLGTPSASNQPGGRYEPAIWQDSKGDVWMFGGNGLDSSGTPLLYGNLNDLWMYNPSTNEWTWEGGSSTVPSVAREQPGVYGTLGTASSANIPGGRFGAVTWTDAQGGFWLFGGIGADANGNQGELNDLWMYNPNTNEWTWEAGSSTVVAGGVAPAVAAAQGAAATGNTPAGREGAFAWTDLKGNLWLFGGEDRPAGFFSDLWEFNPTTAQWTWVSGSLATGAAGSYGIQGSPSSSNLPPGRDYGASWTDKAGNLWLWGGGGVDGSGNDDVYNDQWMYSPSDNEWTWVDGSNTPGSGGSYSSYGAVNSTNMPAARDFPDSWTDKQGDFWMYGGVTPVEPEGNGFYSPLGYDSDLWQYLTPSVASSGPLAAFSPYGLGFAVLSGQVSAPQVVTLSNPGTASLSIGSISLTGSGADAYQQTNDCGSSLAAGASCTISITFSPAASQTYPATLTIADNAPSSPQTITLTGTGNIPTTTSIYASASTLTAGSSLNVTATVASSVGTTVPTGAVTFDEDGNAIGTGTLNGSGVATYSVTSLTLGSHTFTATYPGDSSHGDSASGSVSVTGAASVQISAPQWEWVAGGQTATFITGAPPVYGTLGTPSPTNYPGDVAGATTWTDANGNLWLFYGENAENDLWKYNIASNEWTWVSGVNIFDTTVAPSGVYGTLGTPAAGNTPGGRDNAVNWIDTKGNLWIFGGSGADSNGVFAPLNDLWMFNPSTSLWTWEGGSSTVASAGVAPTGVYGTEGVASPTNVPGGRYEAMSWTDKSGNFWLFGGFGSDSTGTQGNLNDLWEFSPTTGEWTWMGGSSVGNGLGVYGTEGVPAASNVPGSRLSGTTWVDNSGNLWLFGGSGYTNNTYGTGFLNDLWMYSVSTNQWTWVSGSNLANAAGVYGTQGMSNSSNMPDGRVNAASWVDSSGNLWLFGGADQYSSTTYLLSDFLNDLWVYLPSSNSWAWVAGSTTGNQPGVYGTQGTPSAGNIPAARYAPLTWTDANGNFWLMGGANNELNTTFSDFDDLWTAASVGATSPPVVTNTALTASASTIVAGASVTFTATIATTGNSTLTGDVLFYNGPNVIATVPLNGSGVASFSTTSLPVGQPIITAVYVGDANNPESSSEPVGVIVLASISSTSTTLYTSATSVSVGTSVSLVATVVESGGQSIPTGTVTFMDGSTTLGTATLNGSGVANYSTTALAPGSNSITAVYNGDVNNLTSTSAPVVITASAATAATTTTLATNATSVSAGSSVMLTAAVTLTGGPAIQSGTVIFYDGSVSLGTGSLNTSGMATLNTTALTSGANFVTAYYNGDANNSPSTSSAITITVSSSGPVSSSEWIWIGGTQGTNASGPASVYGTEGTPSASNMPAECTGALTWTDKNGNLWMLGGSNFDDALWMYNRLTGQWTWMSGATGHSFGVGGANSGTPAGTPNASIYPSSRMNASTWTDANGNLWLFGGFGIDPYFDLRDLGDLWMYNTTTNEWTWYGGSFLTTQANYGTKGVAAATNLPGPRSGSSTWEDANGNFWMFGGAGYSATATNSVLNDLWMFNPTTGMWTWENGPSTGAVVAVYGTQGTPSAANIPGARTSDMTWTDAHGDLWLFGGEGYDANNANGWLNDLWMYNPATNNWTWVSGSNVLNATYDGQIGVYGTQGTAAAANVPSSRTESAAWVDNNGNFWLFGGQGLDSTGTIGQLNDAWMYNLSTNQWTWMTGSNLASQAGTYGTLDTPAAGNTPPARYSPEFWTDHSGNLWLFSGNYLTQPNSTYTGGQVLYYDDMWEYGVLPTQTQPQAATPAFSVAGGNYSSAQSVTISDTTPNATIYYTSDGTTPTTSSTVYSGAAITVSSTETIEAIATASDYSQSATATATYTISAPQAATPTFNPPGGNYSSAQSVTISDTTPNATIYYTTDSTTPTTSSTVYSGTAIIVPSTETINAIATASGYTQSATATAAYTITLTTPAEDWAWMGGPSVIGSSTGVAPGNYGTLGVPASTNLPLGRDDPETWTDKSGNFWMMGGASLSQSVGVAYLNDLWEYSPSTLEWTWQGGANSIPAGTYGVGDTFGTQGTPSAQTIPAARSGSFTWTDPSGNLWLYGGFGVEDSFLYPTTEPSAFLYSFWKYSPSLGQWTWIAGTDYGVSADVANSIPTYGVMGTPSSANFPGARYSGSTWTDTAGNLWMFGGNVVEGLTYYTDGFTTSAIDGNDLWKFDPTSQQWTWEAGSQITSSASVNPNCTPGVNGTLGQAAPGNTPSGRLGSSSWTDSAGNLWLFGGQGCGSFNINAANQDTWGALNDLWKFNTTTKEWTWEAGGTNADQSGVYGTLGTPSVGNTPGEREGAYAWTDKSGKFWLFGGSGYDSNGKYGSFNDLWMFDPSTNEWTWEGGAETDSGSAGLPGIYGTLGVGAAGNIPGARGGGGAWTDTSGNLWLFGGLGEDASGAYGDLNDLWEYGSGALVTPQAATPTFNVPGGTYSSAQSVIISDTTPNATIYYTTDGSTPTTNSTVYSGTAITVPSTETIEAIATASGYTQSATATATYTVTPTLTTPTVTVSPSPASVTTAQALSVTVTVSGTPTPTGSVTLTSGTYTSGSVTLSNGSVTISIPAGALTTGTDVLTATYTPDANSSSTFTSATGTNTVTVTAAVVTAPVASLTPAGPLTFTAASGSTSAVQSATLSNTGNATLSITSIGITGSNASSFNETNTCGSSLAAGSSCSIAVSFAPSLTGSFTATLSVADNASGSPQAITLNGTGMALAPTFTLSAVTSTSTVSDTTAATYQLTVTPQNGAFTSPISLSASGVPSGYTASFNPASVTPGSSAATATLTISKSPTAMLRRTLPFTAPALAFLGLLFLPGKGRRRLLAMCLLAFASLGAFTALTACGGGFNLTPPPQSYTITVTGTSGSEQQSAAVQLTVE